MFSVVLSPFVFLAIALPPLSCRGYGYGDGGGDGMDGDANRDGGCDVICACVAFAR